MTKPAALTPARRALYVVGALLKLAAGALVLFGLVVLDESTRAPHALAGGVPFAAFAVVLAGTVLSAGAWIGLAIMPARVLAEGRRNTFATGVALGGLALVLAIPSPLACFTWPAAALLAVVATALLVRALRRALPAPRE